ncbi:MAG TPA: hypothetical protein VF816_08705 [Rhodocyclaceae bacterium]
MRTLPSLLFAACLGLAGSAAASAYDVLIFACDNSNCARVAEQTINTGLANAAEFNRNGLRLLIESVERRAGEEDARVSVSMSPAEGAAAVRPVPASLAQRLEAVVVHCTMRYGAYSPLAAFPREGRIYQIWGRLVAAH